MLMKPEELYLPRVSGGRWAIGRPVGTEMIHLIQDTPTADGEPEKVLRALGIAPTPESMNRYFPVLEGKDGLCPTLELLELFARLGATGREVGV